MSGKEASSQLVWESEWLFAVETASYYATSAQTFSSNLIYDVLNPHTRHRHLFVLADVKGTMLKANIGLLTTRTRPPMGRRTQRPAGCCRGLISCCQFGDVSWTDVQALLLHPSRNQSGVTPSSGRSFACYLRRRAFVVVQGKVHCRTSEVHVRGGSKLCQNIKHLWVSTLLFWLGNLYNAVIGCYPNPIVSTLNRKTLWWKQVSLWVKRSPGQQDGW